MRKPCRPKPPVRKAVLAIAVALAAASFGGVAAAQGRRSAQLPPPTPEPAPPATSSDPDKQALLDRIEMLEKRLSDLESTAVLSAPKVLVKEVHVWVDKDGNLYHHRVVGAK
jgi:hypothetical protein